MEKTSSKKRIILIGAGSRGTCYTNKVLDIPDYFEVVAVAEPVSDRRENIKRIHNIKNELCFTT